MPTVSGSISFKVLRHIKYGFFDFKKYYTIIRTNTELIEKDI